MKRSEMIHIIKLQLYGDSHYPEHENEAEALLNVIEEAGMIPPFVPRYHHQGNCDESEYYRWEPEE